MYLSTIHNTIQFTIQKTDLSNHGLNLDLTIMLSTTNMKLKTRKPIATKFPITIAKKQKNR